MRLNIDLTRSLCIAVSLALTERRQSNTGVQPCIRTMFDPKSRYRR